MKKIAFFLSVTLALVSCSKDDDATDQNQVNRKVYVGIENSINDFDKTILWQDGNRTTISELNQETYIQDIKIQGDDVYVLFKEKALGFGNTYPAKLWKNGQITTLTELGSNPQNLRLFLANGKKYISYYEFQSQGNDIVKFWVDGQVTNITDGSNDAGTNAIFVNNNDIFIVGYEIINNIAVGTVWKNGAAIRITNGVLNTYLRDVFIANNAIYVTGSENGRCKYWKKNLSDNSLIAEYSLSQDNFDGVGRSIVVKENDVYVAGDQWNGNVRVAKLWKNGGEIQLSDINSRNFVTDLVVINNDVYVVGEEDVNGGRIAKLWKNGVETNLTDGSDYSTAKCIAVK